MRWVSYDHHGRERIGVVEDGMVFGLDDPHCLIDLLGDDGTALRKAGQRAKASPAEVIPLAETRLQAPIRVPPSVRDFMAFESHVITSMAALGKRVDQAWYEIPAFYFTNPAAIAGPYDDVPIAPTSVEFDYELEVAVVIGAGGSNIGPDEAESHIAGYLIMCDWSARDLQEHEMRINLGPSKGKDTVTTLGPWLVTPDELEPVRKGSAFDLTMTATVNGRCFSEGNLADLFWSFPEMIAYASRGTQLRPGDVMGSGTVGTGCILELALVHGADTFPYLQAGDEVCLEVQRLGTQRCIVAPAMPPVPFRARGREQPAQNAEPTDTT